VIVEWSLEGLCLYTVSDTIHINAPIERCFLLSTSIELVARTLRMKPVLGKTHGLVENGDRVVWQGWKFALPQFHETLITTYEAPTFFRDTMGRGRFKRFQHDHQFTEIDGHTLLQDKVRFSLPFGPLGRMVAERVIVPHIAELVQQRFQLLKRVAETDEWREYLPDLADLDQ
jgi:ligand-binding SRPBCC domain-containing protein